MRDSSRNSSAVRRAAVFHGIDGVLILAAGTSYYAGLTAKYWIEGPRQAAGVRGDRQRIPLPGIGAAPEAARHHHLPVRRDPGYPGSPEARQGLGHDQTLSICNVPESAMPRASKLVFYTRAGAEIGVASTKAFTTQLAALFILRRDLAKLRGRLSTQHEAALHREPAPSAGQRAARAEPGTPDQELGRRLRAAPPRAVLRPRHPLPHRAGRRAEAERDLLHPRGGLSRRRTEARAPGAGGPGHAGGGDRAQRRPAGEGEIQHAGSAGPRRRALRVRRPGQPLRRERRACT